MEKPIENNILSEAEGAHRTSQEILALMQEPGDDDPIQLIFAILKDIAIHQHQMTSDLRAVNEKLNTLLHRQDAAPG
jgi:hypothetical protein